MTQDLAAAMRAARRTICAVEDARARGREPFVTEEAEMIARALLEVASIREEDGSSPKGARPQVHSDEQKAPMRDIFVNDVPYWREAARRIVEAGDAAVGATAGSSPDTRYHAEAFTYAWGLARAYEAMLSTPSDAGGWQPISTAPKDGTWFAIMREGDDDSYEVGCYDPGYWDEYVPAGNDLYRKERKQIHEWRGFNNFGRATHWCPLPLPPSADTQTGERP